MGIDVGLINTSRYCGAILKVASYDFKSDAIPAGLWGSNVAEIIIRLYPHKLVISQLQVVHTEVDRSNIKYPVKYRFILVIYSTLWLATLLNSRVDDSIHKTIKM